MNALKVYEAPGEGTSPLFCDAFARGSKAQWIRRPPAQLLPGDFAMFGSLKLWHLLKQAQAEGRNWYYGDHAYFGRKEFYRITKNAMQHDGSGSATSDRFQEHGIEIKPWRAIGSHILLCPPGDAHYGLFYPGHPAKEWIDSTVAELKKYTDRTIRIRTKLVNGKPNPTPLLHDMKNCWAIVGWKTNVGLQGILEGIPAFIADSNDCTYGRLSSWDLSTIENPTMPEGREQFAWNLAHHQWTLPEIRSGKAWSVLNAS